MTGKVIRLHAVIDMPVNGAMGSGGNVEFIVDTGFSGEITLPQDLVSTLGLAYSHTMEATLADGSVIDVDVYSATVNWLGLWKQVDVLITGDRPLIGVALLENASMYVEFKNQGRVEIARL